MKINDLVKINYKDTEHYKVEKEAKERYNGKAGKIVNILELKEQFGNSKFAYDIEVDNEVLNIFEEFLEG